MTEDFGIVPVLPQDHPAIRDDITEEEIAHYTNSTKYLVRRMKTLIPHLPVATKEERTLYKMTIANYLLPEGGKSVAVDFAIFAQDWNAGALRLPPRVNAHSSLLRIPDGRFIFCKLPEHMKSHFSTFYKSLVHRSISISTRPRLLNLDEMLQQDDSVEFLPPRTATRVVNNASETALLDEIEDEAFATGLANISGVARDTSQTNTRTSNSLESLELPVPGNIDVHAPTSAVVEATSGGSVAVAIAPQQLHTRARNPEGIAKDTTELNVLVQPLRTTALPRLLPSLAPPNAVALQSGLSVPMFRFVPLMPGFGSGLQPPPHPPSANHVPVGSKTNRQCGLCGRLNKPTAAHPSTCAGSSRVTRCQYRLEPLPGFRPTKEALEAMRGP